MSAPETTTEEAAMDDHDPVDRVLDSIRTAETHVETEFRDALPETLATVSARPRYAMTPAPGRLDVVTTPEGVATFYETSRAAFQPRATRHRAQIAADWYVFYEGVPTRGQRSTGREYTINTTVLFPSAADGIVGEFLWERHDEDVDPPVYLPGGPAYPIPLTTVDHLRLHERYLDVLRDGKVGDAAALLADDCLWATRSYLGDTDAAPMVRAEGRDATLEYLDAWTAAYRIEDVTVLNRLATDWYVFAEELYAVDGPDGAQQVRLASIYPVTSDGRLQGQLGYGTDPGPRSARPWPRGGRPVWARADHPDPWLASVR